MNNRLQPVNWTTGRARRGALITSLIIVLIPLSFAYRSLALRRPPLHDHYAPHFADQRLPPAIDQWAYKSLSDRLHTFLSRPVWTHDEGMPIMEEKCPLEISKANTPRYFINAKLDYWKTSIGRQEIIDTRVNVVRHLNGLVEEGRDVLGQKRYAHKRGIVYASGDPVGPITPSRITLSDCQNTAARVKVSLRMLRSVGCTLPVEIFHYPEEGVDDDLRQDLEALGATWRQLETVHRIGGHRDYRIKGSALLQSSFQQILFIDCDNVVVSDPTPLFDHPQFRAKGAVFWPDTYKEVPENAIYRIVGEPCDFDQWAFETGQFMVDKKARGGLMNAALHITEYMLTHSDFWYQFVMGDKDAFRWAWRMLDLEWASPGAALGYAGSSHQADRFCGQ